MADRWIGLCGHNAQNDVRAALRHLDAQAKIAFALSPEDLRQRIHESAFCLGAIVGFLEEPLSSINVAAALARDGMAADVVLVTRGVASGMMERAERAGIPRVVDLDSLPIQPLADLDEPDLPVDDLPTMVVGIAPAWEHEPPQLPPVDTDGDKQGSGGMLEGWGAYALPEDGQLGDDVGSACNAQERETSVAEVEDDGRNALEDDARQGDGAPIITLVSGRGGVGKTSVAAMLATVAARWGMRVGLCDLDLSCGNLYSCFGASNSSDLAMLAEEGAKRTSVGECSTSVAQGVRLWGPCAKPEMAELVYPKIEELLNAVSHDCDLVIVDTSSTFTDAVAQAAQCCDRLVITVDGRPGSVNAQARIAALAVRLGVARTRMVRLANRCGPHGRGEPHINRADVGLETARPLRVLDGGPEVADCMGEGRIDELVDLGSRFAESSAFVLATLLSELGCLPECEDAQKALQSRADKPRWSFGRRREAV